MRHITERERALRKTIYELTAAKPGRDTQAIQDVQDGIYAETGLLAITHFSLDDLTFLHGECLAPATRKMLKLAGRDRPELISMYDLRHSLLSCAGADAAVKAQQAELLCKVVVKKIKERLRAAKAKGKDRVQPVRLLELGSGISDVTSMLWALVMHELRRSEVLGRSGGGCVGGPQDTADDAALLQLFQITNVEYSEPTGRTAAALLASAGRSNVSVRYGPEIGDATILQGLKDSSFDVVWSSLMLGAFDALPVEKGRTQGRPLCDGYSTASNVSSSGSDTHSPRVAQGIEHVVTMDVPGARAVMDQAWRVAKDGATICHSGFAYLVKPDDLPFTKFPWRRENPQPRLSVDLMMRLSTPLRQMTRRLTDVEFDYWKWVDGGDFARYECELGQAAGKYRSLKVRRFAGCKSWPVPLVQGTWRLMTSGKDPQAALSKDVFENCEAMTRSAGPCFTTTTVVVAKGPLN